MAQNVASRVTVHRWRAAKVMAYFKLTNILSSRKILICKGTSCLLLLNLGQLHLYIYICSYNGKPTADNHYISLYKIGQEIFRFRFHEV